VCSTGSQASPEGLNRRGAGLAVDVEQLPDRRLAHGTCRAWRPAAAEHLRERRPDCRRSSRADSRQRFEAAVVSGHFECFEGVDAELLVQPVGEFGADAGDGAQPCGRVGIAAHMLELAPAAGREHLGDRGGDPRPDARQCVEAGQALGGMDLAHLAAEPGDGVRGLAVGCGAVRVAVLRVDERGHLAQALRDPGVVDRRHGGESCGRFASSSAATTSSSSTWWNST
jgi:hypothetical protein